MERGSGRIAASAEQEQVRRDALIRFIYAAVAAEVADADAVLRQAGYSADEIGRLRALGVLGK